MKKQQLISLFLFILVLSLQAVTYESGSLENFLYGTEPECSYDNYVSHIAEGIARANYNLYAPWEEQTDGFGGYHIPTEDELILWELVYGSYLNGDLEIAEETIETYGFPYEVVVFADNTTGRTYHILRENVDYQYYDDNGTEETYDDEYGAFAWGWGFYLYNPDAENPIIISVPHPNDDFITVPMAVKCLEEWDAMFLFISGAGREVEWTEVGWYNNGKSLSDPTRNSDHPLIVANHQAVDLIRQSFRHEFSFQVHSYDWNRHAGYANTQFSVVQSNPNLPLRDLSDLHLDMINQADLLMVPEGEFGEHTNSWLNDYYAVYYSQYPFQYVNEDTVITVNNNIDLPGVGGDFLYYSVENWNHYDVYDPFLHVEMDELPNEFEQNTDQYYMFYGYDSEEGEWSFEDRYEKTTGWYSRWIDDLTPALMASLELDDGLLPQAPENIWFENIDNSSLQINWEPIPAYDHYSYRVYIDTTSIDTATVAYFDRADDQILASSLKDNFTLDGLEMNREYYLLIAVEDYNDNIVFSEEVSVLTAPALIDDFAEYGGDGFVELHWSASMQEGNQGFNVFRRTQGSDYELIADWQTDPELESDGTNGQEFLFIDNGISNNQSYYYKISMNNESGYEYFYDEYLLVRPGKVYELEFTGSNGLSSEIQFSWNFNATSGYDEYYDLPGSSYQGEEFYVSIHQPDWTHSWLTRDIRGYYNLNTDWESWNIEVMTQFPADSVLVEVSDDFSDQYRLYLLNEETEEMSIMHAEENSYFSLNENGVASLKLYAGALHPEVEFTEASSQLYQPGETLTLEYDAEFTQLIDHYSVILTNSETDIIVQDSTSSMFPEEISWVVPDTINAQGLTPVIYYVSDMGTQYIAEAEYEIGIVPSDFSYEITEGWQNFSNVWVDSIITVSEFFEENAALYSLTDSGYVQQTIAEFGEGYWLETSISQEITANGEYQTAEYEKLLLPGWNLLANPFPCEISIEGLIFEYFSITRDFSYMVEHDHISHNVYVYRDSAYTATLTVNAGEAFYLYNLRDETISITVHFIPGNSGSPLSPVSSLFTLGYEASQFNDTSTCYLGASSTSTDGFDPLYDYPALPLKPDAQGCRISIFPFPGGYPQSTMQTIFMGSFWDEQVKQHEIVINAQPEEEILLKFLEDDLPVNYFSWIETGEEIIDLDLADQIVLEVPEAGYITATAYIEYPRIWHYGDINKNERVEALDAALVLQYSVGIDPQPMAPLPWLQWRQITADVDGNSELSSYDASLILQYCVDLVSEFPVETREVEPVPAGSIRLVSYGNIIKAISEGNVYSFDLSLNIEVTETTVNCDILSAKRQSENFLFASASAEEISSGMELAEFIVSAKSRIPDQAEVVINGRQQTVEIYENDIPLVTGLMPVSPNPFVYSEQRGFSISFDLAKSAVSKFSIYNIKGQKVKTIKTEFLESGRHQINWDMTNAGGRMVSSGVYFIRMSANDFRETRKFVFIR